MLACWLRSVLVTRSVLESSWPNCSRRCAMIDDSASMFASAWGTTAGRPVICLPSTVSDAANWSESSCSKVLVASFSAACRS
ncbi:Uncharacterised protein [Mycobacterium tuberculosis]|nr:Uncharacterised protein [Mycobacterium tuberculosis]